MYLGPFPRNILSCINYISLLQSSYIVQCCSAKFGSQFTPFFSKYSFLKGHSYTYLYFGLWLLVVSRANIPHPYFYDNLSFMYNFNKKNTQKIDYMHLYIYIIPLGINFLIWKLVCILFFSSIWFIKYIYFYTFLSRSVIYLILLTYKVAQKSTAFFCKFWKPYTVESFTIVASKFRGLMMDIDFLVFAKHAKVCV